MPRTGTWTGGRDPSIHRRWHLSFHLEVGALRPPVVTFAKRAGSQLGEGLIPMLFPLKHSMQKFPSTMVANSRCRPQSGGGSNEVMSLSIHTWLVVLVDPVNFLLQPQTLSFFMNIWG
jgi:hypothetical protein